MESTAQNRTAMEATAHFYDGDTNVALQYPNERGGSTFYFCDEVSEILNYAKRNGMDITNVITHHDC